MKRKHVVLTVSVGAVLLTLATYVVLRPFIGFYGPDSITNWHRAKVEESVRRGDQIIAALHAYKARFGAYPANLTDLVPAFLTDVPPPTAGTQFWYYFRPADRSDFFILRVDQRLDGARYAEFKSDDGSWYVSYEGFW